MLVHRSIRLGHPWSWGGGVGANAGRVVSLGSPKALERGPAEVLTGAWYPPLGLAASRRAVVMGRAHSPPKKGKLCLPILDS
jgi:hypothetical protein